MKVGEVLYSTFKHLRLIDEHDGKLSLTSLAMWVVLVKLAIAPQPSLVDAAAFLIAIGSYQGKKLINSQSAPEASLSEELEKKVSELQSQVSALSLSAGIKKLSSKE